MVETVSGFEGLFNPNAWLKRKPVFDGSVYGLICFRPYKQEPIRLWFHSGSGTNKLLHQNIEGAAGIQNYCSLGNGNRCSVTPSRKLVAWILENMLHIENDQLYFELIRGDGWNRLYIKYNQILGSRLLWEGSPIDLPNDGN